LFGCFIMKSLTYIEIDIPAFILNGSPTPEVTLRFSTDVDYLPNTINAIPSIKDVQLSPAIISLGENLGQRATLTVTFKDHRHIFNGESFESGTFWGKFRARYGLRLRGHPIRLVRGLLGESIEDMATQHYLIESVDGPTFAGEYKIIGKDLLKFADGDRSQAPLPSNGFLVANITNVVTSATLSPSGIGNAEYPASGYVAIGGKEICAFTRAADVLTLTRAQFNTTAEAHNAGDRVQLCLHYNGEDAAEVISDLLISYAGIDASYIPLAAWQAETSGFLGTVYTALIAEPTAVNKLISELVEQAALAIWWDEVEQRINLQVLRAVSTEADIYDEDNIIAGSLEIREQPDKRLSQVYTYFGKINPLVKGDEEDNYRSTVLTIDSDAESEYGTPAIKKVFSRWIPAGGRTIAETLNNKLLGRYVDPPRRFTFDLFRYGGQTPLLGQGYQLQAWPLQDTDGSGVQVPIQIFRLNPRPDVFELEAEEMLWTPYGGDVDPTQRAIIFDANENNINLRTRHDELYPEPVSGDTVTATINSGVIIGSNSTATPAIHIGDWPAGVTVNLIVNGRIQGKAGNGGSGGTNGLGNGSAGGAGGTALYTRENINLTSTSGAIWGGGGGGGGGGGNLSNFGGGGGGGAGTLVGSGGPRGGSGGSPEANNGADGTATTGGAGGTGSGVSANGATGGNGGGPGLAGSNGGTSSSPGNGGSGGAAGIAIDGDSFTTNIGAEGDIRGSQIN
jgi:hypothetical protein